MVLPAKLMPLAIPLPDRLQKSRIPPFVEKIHLAS
jgi:hypothetical protein